MDWVNRMNGAIDYIEEHLDDRIDVAEAAKRAHCSAYHFQRMFPFMTDVTLSEYIRRRRLTVAAFELQSGTDKVIDLALKYGYDSPEAFTRAFQQQHGTTPSNARKTGVKLKAYPRLTFQLSIKGVAEMNYRVEKLEAFSIVGKEHTVNHEGVFGVIPQLWEEARREDLFEKLWSLRDAEHPMGGILGVCADGAWGRGEAFHYILSIASSAEVPSGMIKRDIPQATWVVFEAEGSPDNLVNVWGRLYEEWLPVAAYELADIPAIEVYLPMEANRNELWVPVVRK